MRGMVYRTRFMTTLEHANAALSKLRVAKRPLAKLGAQFYGNSETIGKEMIWGKRGAEDDV